ncbi:MAG: Hint domain-containing protein [Bdellovibrionota bacterium]
MKEVMNKIKIFVLAATLGASIGSGAHANEIDCGCDKGIVPKDREAQLAYQKALSLCLKDCIKNKEIQSNKNHSIFFNVSPARCETDSLSIPEGRGRIQWAIRTPNIMAAEANILSNEIAKERPKYPTYGFWDEERQVYTNPIGWRAPTDIAAAPEVPTGYEIMGLCTAGCYAKGQKVWIKMGYAEVDQLNLFDAPEIYTLTKESTLERLRYKLTPVKSYTVSATDASQEIVDIYTESGRRLSVTTNHPMMLDAGVMVEAATLKMNDFLFGVDGLRDRVVRLEHKTTFGKVYNVEVDSTDLLENVIVAEGLLTGALYYQNEGVEHLNRVLLRRSLKGI